MKKYLGIVAALLLITFMSQTVGASGINYTATDLGNNRWQYDYTVFNDSQSDVIGAFDVIYAYGDYGNLEYLNPATDDGWIADSPYDLAGTSSDFIVDGLFSVWDFGILPGDSLGVFSLAFDWLGNGVPGDQPFIFYDGNWGELGDGWTSRAQPPVVPEPQSFMLLGTGILGLAAYYRVRNARKR